MSLQPNKRIAQNHNQHMKIFYSWQSDTDKTLNHYFIRDALEKALKQLKTEPFIQEAERELELDHDTKNVPGIPAVTETIFDKISKSSVFVADVSFVGERAENKKQLPNPNVMVELGYAIARLGSDKIIHIINTAFGNPKDLPFDLNYRRFPISYNLTSSENIKEIKANLVTELKSAISLIIQPEMYRSAETFLSINPSTQEIYSVIMTSNSRDDWERLTTKGKNTAYLKSNPNLRFEITYDEDGTEWEDFKEEWANQHPDPHAKGYYCKLYYTATHINTFSLISVDGGRALLPLTTSRLSMQVRALDFKIAEIFDSQSSLYVYMQRSGLSIEGKLK